MSSSSIACGQETSGQKGQSYEEPDEQEEVEQPEDSSDEDEDETNCVQQESTPLSISSLANELTNPILECLANIEIPYRCIYMSCGNFFVNKSQMLSHMRCDHGVEISLHPVMPSNFNRETSLMQVISQLKPSSISSVDTKSAMNEGTTVAPARSRVHGAEQSSQVKGHVRHKCPYAQCFTCPHCFTCYSTPYRLTLHIKCSHRLVTEMTPSVHQMKQVTMKVDPPQSVSTSVAPSVSQVKS